MHQVFESDSKALEALYDLYSPLVFTLIKKIVKDDKYTDEIIGNVFGIIWRKAKYADLNTNNIYSWIIYLTRNRSIDVIKRKSDRVSLPEYTFEYENQFILPRLSLISEHLDLAIALSSMQKIENALKDLTQTQQYVIELAFYGGFTLKEISEKLKVPLQTVKTKIKNTIIKLHEEFTGIKSRYIIANDVVNLVYPFVLGCLDDKEANDALISFFSMENFPWKILGEYQNMIALLPIVLDIENPPAKLKEKIAAQLYHLRKDEDLMYQTSFKEKSEFSESSGELDEKVKEKTQKFERIEHLIEEQAPLIENIEKETASENENKIEKKSYTGLLTVIFIIILIGVFVLAYYLYQDRVEKYEKQIANLTQVIDSFKKESLSRPEIPGLAGLTDLKTVNLQPTAVDSLSKARVLLSFSETKGYFHVIYLPQLSPGLAYQLWGRFFTARDIEMQTNGSILLLGTFKVSSQPDYYPFRFSEITDAVSAEFLVTESPVYGLRSPGSSVYLKGTIK